LALAAVTSSRGSEPANLATADPKEVWADSAVGSTAQIFVDLGSVQAIDTVFLGFVRSAAAAATWAITGANPADVTLQDFTALRVPDSTGDFATTGHALWTGAARSVRQLTISVNQPAGSLPLSIGVLVIGRAFVAEMGQEWGAGRQPIDTGAATPLPSGGFSIVEGARKRAFTWTFGDLSVDEADQLERIALDRGETRPVLVIDNASRTAGLRARIHYGLFRRWAAYERRNRRQTRWELGVEEWV
jgi:hypothetical protein